MFPLLAVDLDSFHGINAFNVYVGPFHIIVGMGAALIGSLITSLIFNGKLNPRDLIHGPIAGGVITGSASFFITNPVYALVVGFTGGVVQALLQNSIEHKWVQ